jgi:ABC-type Mn2+/Zn2+ transport system permease subunit
MNDLVELDRRSWNVAVRLAAALSVVAAFVAVFVSAAGDVPQAAIVVPVIVVAFTASWITTGRVRRTGAVGMATPRLQHPT